MLCRGTKSVTYMVMRVVPAGHLKLDMTGRYYVHMIIFGHDSSTGQ